MRRTATFGLLVVLLAGSLSVTGCSSSSFLGRQWANFNAYYNTFYNAQQSFRQAERAIVEGMEPIDRDAYLSVYPLPQQATQANLLQSTVEKSAKLLRDHSDSKYVEDALLLIGKSYYYQHNFAGAEQKFREVIALEEERADEARLWLARTLKATEQYEAGITLLQERLSTMEASGDWFSRMHLMLGELHVAAGNLTEAVGALQRGLEEIDEDRQGARAQFLLGQIYEGTGEYEAAVEAYSAVQDFGPVYELSYAAQLNYVEVVGVHLDPQRGLNVLTSMQRDDKHFERRDELALMRARLLKQAGRTDEAHSVYRTILYGQSGATPQGRSAGVGGDLERRIHYRLAELYRDNLVDYSLAAAHFDSASGSPSSVSGSGEAEGGARLLPDAVTGVSETAQLYGRFSEVAGEVHRMDSLLYLGSLDQAAFDSVIRAVQIRRAERARARRERLEEEQQQQAFQSRTQSLSDEQSSGTATTSQSAADAISSQASFLFHEDPVELQKSRAQFQLQWGNRPLVPDWRRQDAIRSSGSRGEQVAEERSAQDGEAAGDQQAGTFLPPVDTSQVPRDSLERYRMRADRAEARYRLGNILFLMMNRPDSASTWYQMVIREDGEYAVAARAFYALAELRKEQGDSVSARRLYEELIRRYPGSPLARQVERQLEVRQRAEARTGVDSLARARSAYDRAYHAWREDGATDEALDGMLLTARTYPGTPYAARALLAAGYIVQERGSGAPETLDSPIALPTPSLCCDPLGVPSGGTAASDSSLFARPVSLETLFTILERDFPESRYVRRAEALRATFVPSDTSGQVARQVDSTNDSLPVSSRTGSQNSSTEATSGPAPPDSSRVLSGEEPR